MKALSLALCFCSILFADALGERAFESGSKSGKNVYSPVNSSVDVQKQMQIQKNDANVSVKTENAISGGGTSERHKGH